MILGGFPPPFSETSIMFVPRVCMWCLQHQTWSSHISGSSESGAPQGGHLQCFDQRLCDSITLATGAIAFLEHLGVIQGFLCLVAGTERSLLSKGKMDFKPKTLHFLTGISLAVSEERFLLQNEQTFLVNEIQYINMMTFKLVAWFNDSYDYIRDSHKKFYIFSVVDMYIHTHISDHLFPIRSWRFSHDVPPIQRHCVALLPWRNLLYAPAWGKPKKNGMGGIGFCIGKKTNRWWFSWIRRI